MVPMICPKQGECMFSSLLSLVSSRRQADTVKLAQALSTNISRGSGAGGASGANGNGIGHPFEFRVLECLLAATVSYFEGEHSSADTMHTLWWSAGRQRLRGAAPLRCSSFTS